MFMKKISLLALAFISALAVNAQQDPDKAHKPLRTDMSTQPRFGLKAGVNLATLEIDDDSQSNPYNTNNKTGFHGGVFVNLPLGGALALQPEAVFSTQGSKVSGTVSTPTGNLNYRDELDFYYLNVPVMLQLKATSGLFFEVGPQVGFLLKAENEDGDDLKEDMKKTDFGAGAGIGYLSRVGLGLNARYTMGFSNIMEDNSAGDEGKYKNRVLSIGLVYHLGAHK